MDYGFDVATIHKSFTIYYFHASCCRLMRYTWVGCTNQSPALSVVSNNNIIVRVKHLDYIAEISQFIYLEIVFSHIKCFQASESLCRVWSWVSRWRPHTSTTTKSDSSASQPSQVTDTNILFLVLVFETFIYRCYKYLLLDESNATIVMWEWCVLDRAGKRTFAKFEVEQPRAFAWLKVPTNY